MVKLAGLSNKKKESKITDSYKQWREFNKGVKDGFYILPSGIKKYLPYFDGKAMNLYLYYCLHSDNKTGESWHSTQKCAEELKVTDRSINNWNKILENIGLIVRTKNNRKSMSTFLLPISNYVVGNYEDNAIHYLEKYKESQHLKDIDGELVNVYNLFQFRKNKDTNNYDDPYNVLCFTFERTHVYEKEGIDFKVRKHILIHEGFIQQDDVDFDVNDIVDDAYRIKDSSINIRSKIASEKLGLEGKIIYGNLAINSKFNLKKPLSTEVLELLEELSKQRENLGEMEYVTT